MLIKQVFCKVLIINIDREFLFLSIKIRILLIINITKLKYPETRNPLNPYQDLVIVSILASQFHKKNK